MTMRRKQRMQRNYRTALRSTIGIGVLLTILGSLVGCAGGGQRIAATPQRPTFSNDTFTTAKNTFEIETGVAVDPGDELETAVTGKVGVTDHADLLLTWSPHLVLERPGRDARGQGDVFVASRVRLREDEDGIPAVALLGTVKIPTASDRRGVGSGELDALFTGIVTKQIDAFSITANYQLGFLGEPGDGGFDLQHAFAIAAGTGLSDRVGVFAEVAGVFVHEQDVESVFTTAGLTYTPTPSVVLDAGAVTGLSSDAPEFRLFVGATINLTGLFARPSMDHQP